jgi:hypothetical protein
MAELTPNKDGSGRKSDEETLGEASLLAAHHPLLSGPPEFANDPIPPASFSFVSFCFAVADA